MTKLKIHLTATISFLFHSIVQGASFKIFSYSSAVSFPLNFYNLPVYILNSFSATCTSFVIDINFVNDTKMVLFFQSSI